MKDFYLRHKLIINAIILGLFPITVALIKTLSNGEGICDVWLPGSTWNDELIYFKQVQCIVTDGIPRGFFGYNESHAAWGNLGAWSPVILLPWALLGKVFGWGYLSPVIYNIVFLTVAMFLFGILAKPSFKETIGIFIVLGFTPLSRYLLSAMPEIICTAPAIVTAGLAIGSAGQEKKRGKMAGMLLLCFFMTLMRPYLAVMYIFPLARAFNLQKKTIPAIFVTGFMSLAGYVLISKFMLADYMGDVYSTEWLKGGVGNFIKTLGDGIMAVLNACIRGFTEGYGPGLYFDAFLFLSLLLLIRIVCEARKENCVVRWSVCALICNGCFFIALLLMYTVRDGFRHLLIFIVLSILVLIKGEKNLWVKSGLALVGLVVIFTILARDPEYFGVPYKGDGVTPDELSEFKEGISGKVKIFEEAGYENTCLVVLADTVGDEYKLTDWQYLYGLPEEMAVNICTADYIKENMDGIKSGYIMVPARGEISEFLNEKYMRYLSYSAIHDPVAHPIWGNDDIVLYGQYR